MAFKMKRTPMLKRGGLKEFFSSLGNQLKKGTQRRIDKKYESAGPNIRKQMEKEGYATPESRANKAKNSEANKVNETVSTKTKSTPKAAKPTFKNAFATARKAGKKTFSWNGKSYTTELAKTKKKKTPSTPKVKKGGSNDINQDGIDDDIQGVTKNR